MSEKTSLFKRLFHLAGYLIVIGCLVLVGVQIYRYAPDVSGYLVRKGTLTSLGLSSLVYAAGFAILALAWHVLLKRIFGASSAFANSYYVYARTSIAKYLPGNVGHVVGRQMVGKSKGLPHASVAGASVMEIVCLVCVAAMICLWMELPVTTAVPTWVYFVVSGCVMLAAPFVVIQIEKRRDGEAFKGRSFAGLYQSLGIVCLLDLGFFLVTGTLLYYLALGAGIELGMSLISVVAVYAVSWFLGLVTPGAPAGAGVREAVIIAMFGMTTTEPQALAVALLFRIMTTAGDVLFFGSSFLPGLRGDDPQQ